jgi:hypothetical protein
MRKLLFVGVVVGSVLGAPWLLWFLYWLLPAAARA